MSKKVEKTANTDNRQPRQARSDSQATRDTVLISEMYLRHCSQWEIANKLGLDQSTVSRELKRLQTEWKERAAQNMNEAKTLELARIDALEREAMAAWEKSKGSHREQLTRSRGLLDGKDKKVKTVNAADMQIRQWESEGDPRYLAVALQCIERRCKILGVDAPRRRVDYQLSAQTPKPVLRRIAQGMPVDLALNEYALGINEDRYGTK
jgi:hypothetical protein